MPKSPSAFAGIKLTEQTSPKTSGLDQRLFSPTIPQQPPERTIQQKSQEVGKEGTREIVKETSQPGKREGSQLFDINEKPYRKDSFLFTTEEFEALEDLKIDLRRKFDMKATKNDLARCALHHLVEDYQRHKEASIVVRRLRARTAR